MYQTYKYSRIKRSSEKKPGANIGGGGGSDGDKSMQGI